MALIQQIDQDLAAAMKSGQVDRVTVLRLVKSALKNEQIKQGRELAEADAIKVLQREAKQRRDSIEAYTQGGRPELASSEQAELAVIQSYLPQALSQAELTELIEAAISETGATSKAQLGQVIAAVMAKAAGRAEGAAVSKLAAERLSEQG